MSARRATASVLGAAAVLATVAGCAGGGLTNGASAVDKATASATPSADPAAALLDGPRLKSFLLTGTDVPAGYRPALAYTRDSGATLAAPGSVVPGADAVGCMSLTTTGFLSQGAGPSAASFAQDEFDDVDSQTITSEVEDYRGNDAATVMTAFLKQLSDCAWFTDPADANRPTYHVVTQAGPAVGDDSVQFKMTSAKYVGGQTGVVVRVGNLLIAVFHSTTHTGDFGATAYGDAAKVTARVLAAAR